MFPVLPHVRGNGRASLVHVLLLLLSYRVVDAPDEIGDVIAVLRSCGPPHLDVADGVVAPPGDELVYVQDEADDDLDEHRQVQVPVDALLFGPQRPVRWRSSRLTLLSRLLDFHGYGRGRYVRRDHLEWELYAWKKVAYPNWVYTDLKAERMQSEARMEAKLML